MARIRSIHPGLYSDPEFAALSDAAQTFYLGLLTEADDQGIFEWKPNTLRIRLRPLKDGPVDGLLSELMAAEKIVSGEIEGRKLGAIRNFRKFQRPKSPNAIYPITPEWRIYVGIDKPIPEPPPPEQASFPGNGEKSPLMEDEGGNSEPIGSGADDPPSVTSVVFGAGLAWLKKASGKPDDQCRSLLGKWRKQLGDEALIAALGRAQREGVIDPAAWMTKAVEAHQAQRGPPKRQGFNG